MRHSHASTRREGGVAKDQVTDWRAIGILVVALAAPYVLSQFLRNAVGVIAPDLAREFVLSPAETGLVASSFFISFALVQMPLGAFIDVRGPKQAILVGIGLVVAGLLVFASAEGRTGLLVGRLLSGAGCGAFYMCALTIYARSFPAGLFATIAGLQLAIGNLGTLLSTTPLAEAVSAIGWRSSFASAAIYAALTAILVVFIAPRDRTPAASDSALGWLEAFRGFGSITRDPDFWPIFAMHAISVAIFVTVAGLWAGPWLTDIYGFDLRGRGRMLLLIAVAQIAGVFVLGTSDRLFRSYRVPVTVCASVVAVLLFLAAVIRIPEALLPLWLIAFGFFVSFTPVLTAHGRLLFDKPQLGRGLTFLNFGVMAGAFLMQYGTGLVIRCVAGPTTGGYAPEAYATVYGAIALVIAVVLMAYSRTRDRHPLKNS
jgi:predicted MFS family arabinose efflux permease